MTTLHETSPLCCSTPNVYSECARFDSQKHNCHQLFLFYSEVAISAVYVFRHLLVKANVNNMGSHTVALNISCPCNEMSAWWWWLV